MRCGRPEVASFTLIAGGSCYLSRGNLHMGIIAVCYILISPGRVPNGIPIAKSVRDIVGSGAKIAIHIEELTSNFDRLIYIIIRIFSLEVNIITCFNIFWDDTKPLGIARPVIVYPTNSCCIVEQIKGFTPSEITAARARG